MRNVSARPIAPGRAALSVLLALVALMLAAPSAWGVIVHLRNGKALSFQPLRGASSAAASAAPPLDALFSNLDYNGGPVMPSNTNYAIYWRPSSGVPAYPAEYLSGIDTYFEDLAHDSGGHQNTDSVSGQYNDWEGDHARYDSQFGGEFLDTDPYPPNGCEEAPICLTEEQLEEELAKFIEKHNLPTDLQHEYFLLTPPTVEDCFFETSGIACSAGSKKPAYCAYHSAFNVSTGVVVFANDPYVTGNPGCDDGNHPNGKPSDGVIEGGLSHEHNESITDPEPNSGWTDLGGTGGEIGDKCRTGKAASEFGTPLGEVVVGGKKYKYDQVINGHYYWYQQEWSNEGKQCKQRWTPAAAPATATFTSEPAAGTNEMKFNAAASTAPGGVAEYNWKFAASRTPTETSGPTVSHKFPGTGKWEVALTVYASDGESAGTARLIATADEGPTAAFSASTTTPELGQPVTFEGGESHDPDGSITAYEWNFGDGSPGVSGAAATHAYAAFGTYTATLRVTDKSGQIATATRVVEVDEVDEPPTAEFSFAPSTATAGSPVAFNAAASRDEDGSIASFAWNFGDGSAAGSGVAPGHTFGSPGTYTVTLTVTDIAGRTASAARSVTVLEAPPAPPAPPVLVSGLSGYSSGPAGASSAAGGAPGTGAISSFTSTDSVDPASGVITFSASVSGGGTFRWLSTFANGRFGVFTTRSSKCRRGFVWLRGRCRPSAIVFAKGSKVVASPGSVKLVLIPTRAGRKAIASARRQRRGLPVSITVTFQPAQGGPAISHTFRIVIRGSRHA